MYNVTTTGRVNYFRSNINFFVAFAFIGVYVFGIGLVVWVAAFGHNPVADAIEHEMAASPTQQ